MDASIRKNFLFLERIWFQNVNNKLKSIYCKNKSSNNGHMLGLIYKLEKDANCSHRSLVKRYGEYSWYIRCHAFVILKVKCIHFLDVDFKVSCIKVFGKLIFFITFIVPLQHFCLIHSIYFRLSRPPEFSLKIGAKL